MRSLRGRLLAAIGGTVIAAWVVTAVFSWLDARDRIGEMLDDHLVQAATLLLTAGHSREARRPAVHWGHEDEGHSLAYQGWSDDGRLLFRSADAPDEPLGPRPEGFDTVVRDGVRWRVFGLRLADERWRVQVAEPADFRNELAASVASHLLHPLLVAVPLLALLIWLAVRWSLAPLRALASDVARRQPGDLDPIPARDAPVEVAPLVAGLDALLGRVSASIEKERRFTADAAHELRTPLAAIRTHADVALAARDDDERTRALTHVEEGIDRTSRLVEQLLVLARLDARAAPASFEAVSLRDLAARQVADAAAFASEKDVNLGLLDGGDDARVPGDADLLGVLLRNLVDNAVRYTPPGGRVDVSVASEGQAAVLTVADSGPGVSPQERARLVERFHRGGRSDQQGSGLGLSIVARIAELHRASLEFSEGLEGRGLAVAVTFAAFRKP